MLRIVNLHANAGGKEILIRTAQVLRETCTELGWAHRSTINITVTRDARPHYRNHITENDVIWLERGA